jgi:hypothetical protein
MAIDLNKANNDKNLISSHLVKFSNELINEAKQAGIDLRIFEGYRSNERQDYLYKQGTTSLKGGQSKHNKKPSEAITILEYKKGQPTWGNFPQTKQFKDIVNNLLLNHPSVEWGGNWTKPLVYQFEIKSKITPVNIIPPIQPSKVINITPVTPINTPEKPKLIPASVKVEVDNSTIIVGVILLAGFLYFRNRK